jgi:DNA-binding transcriptional LysR family regulator
MELRNLRTFRSVARLLSFHGAAKELNYAQSTVSAQIQALEEELGVRLFDRLGRGILLTEAGEGLLGYAQKMLDLGEAARAELMEAGSASGSLTIRVPDSFCVYHLPRAIRRFHFSHPDVRLHFINCTHDGLYKDLRKGVTDLAFLLTDSISAGDLKVEALGTESLVLVSGTSHPLAAKAAIEPADLSGQTLLLSKVDCSYRRLLESELRRHGVQPRAILDFNSVAAIKECLVQGLGISVLPQVTVRDDVSSGRLTILPWHENSLEVACLMIWHHNRWLSPALLAFMDVVRQEMANEFQEFEG